MAGESAGSIKVTSGAALTLNSDLFGGMLIGSDARNVRLGVLGASADAFGFMNKGAVQGAGVYDGVNAVGLKFGGLGRTVTVDGGIWNSGSIMATGDKASATAFWMGAGASSANLTNAAVIKASTVATDVNDIAAIRIDVGASLPFLANSDTTITPSITGDVLFGSGAAGAAGGCAERRRGLRLGRRQPGDQWRRQAEGRAHRRRRRPDLRLQAGGARQLHPDQGGHPDHRDPGPEPAGDTPYLYKTTLRVDTPTTSLVSGDGADATTARFVSGGSAFTISSPELSGGGAVVRLALRGQSDDVDFALEGGGVIRDDYEAYDARIVARMVF